MKPRPVFARGRMVLFFILAFLSSSALAFSPYNGKKFKDARFTATGGLFFDERRAIGEVDFKFKGDNPGETTCTFKGKAEVDGKQKRFKGKLEFKMDGTVEIDGLPGQGDEKISGTYTIDGTTVNFEGEKKVNIPGVGEVKVKVSGSMSISNKGDVRIRGTVDAGPAGGRFDMNSAKDPPQNK